MNSSKLTFFSFNIIFLTKFFSDIRYSELAKINFLHTGLETQVNAVGTDVAGYLQSEYEKKIVSSIEKIQKEVKIIISAFIFNCFFHFTD